MPDIALLANRERLRKREDRILDMSIIVAIVLLVFRQHSASFKDFTAIVAEVLRSSTCLRHNHDLIYKIHTCLDSDEACAV